MDRFDVILMGLLLTAVLSLIPLTAVDLLQDKIKRGERIYIRERFEFYKATDPQDKNSEALYWFIQGIKNDRTGDYNG